MVPPLPLVAWHPGERPPELRRLRARMAGPPPGVNRTALAVIRAVQEGGDKALLDILEQRGHRLESAEQLRVPRSELGRLASGIDEALLRGLEHAADNLRRFHELQRRRLEQPAAAGALTEELIPLESVGIHIPGGPDGGAVAALMGAIPAAVAGVDRLVAAAAPEAVRSSPALAAALQIAGIDEVYGVSGAPAVAALAFGTETIERVQTVVGPGDVEAAAAKRLVWGAVGMDAYSGPPELVLVADGSSPAAWAAGDLLAVAERNEAALAVLVTWQPAFAAEVNEQLAEQLATLPRADVARRALAGLGVAFTVQGPEAAGRLVDRIAPQQVSLQVSRPDDLADRIRNTSALLLGPYSPEPIGRYGAGFNHVLPTAGTVRFDSGLGVDDFLRRRVRVRFTGAQLAAVADDIERLGASEGMEAPGRAVRLRRTFTPGE